MSQEALFTDVFSCFRQMYSLFVGDLTPEVDDGMLYEFFYNRYPSCRGGKVVLDSMGNSKYVTVSREHVGNVSLTCLCLVSLSSTSVLDSRS